MGGRMDGLIDGWVNDWADVWVGGQMDETMKTTSQNPNHMDEQMKGVADVSGLDEQWTHQQQMNGYFDGWLDG